MAVALAGLPVGHAVGGDLRAVAADGRSGKRQHALEERQAPPQITALAKEAGKIVGRHDHGQIGDVQTVAF